MSDDENLYLRSGIWYARVKVKGKDIRRSLQTGNRTKAKARLKEILDQAERARVGLTLKKDEKVWEDAVVRFTTLSQESLKASTFKRYQVSLRALNPYFAGRALAGINQSTFSEYATERIKSGVKPATVRRDLTVCSLVMKAAKRAGWATENPALEELGEIKEKRDVIRPVPLRHLALFLSDIPKDFAKLVRFIAQTGCRQNEAVDLEWRDVSLKDGTVTFAETKTSTPRTIELSPSCARLLASIPRRKDCPYVFGPQGGENFKNVSSRFAGFVARIFPNEDDRFRCHDLRHTFAIRALMAGENPWAVSRTLGHSRFSTTEGYIKWLRVKRSGGTNRGTGHTEGSERRY